jgi:hypothetical protein
MRGTAAALGVPPVYMITTVQRGLLLFGASINRMMRGRDPRLIKSRPL